MLHCPATLHLVAPLPTEQAVELARRLRSERIAFVWSSPGPAAGAAAAALAGALDVPQRVDPDLAGLDVAHFGRGETADGDCPAALEGIADLHRGEHVVVVGDVPAGPGEALLRRLDIGDDGWRPVTS